MTQNFHGCNVDRYSILIVLSIFKPPLTQTVIHSTIYKTVLMSLIRADRRKIQDDIKMDLTKRGYYDVDRISLRTGTRERLK